MYKFIFVDDEDLIRELFQELLDYKEYGFVLEKSFSSAEQALQYLEEHKEIDLVITDIKMGSMSGIELCENIRKTNTTIQLAVLSGYKEFEYARKAIQFNVFDYILKPTTYTDLDSFFKKIKAYLDEQNEGPPEKPEYHYTQLIDSAKQYISENFSDDNISLEDVAKHISMNPTYFSRYFKQQTGINFIEYLSGVRIQKAKELLQDNRIKVYEICNMVGYKNTQYFYKVFRANTGLTPTEFRSKNL